MHCRYRPAVFDGARCTAISLPVGTELCKLRWRASVDARVSRILSSKNISGRFTAAPLPPRPHLASHGKTSVKGPEGLIKTDGKRPDGCTRIPYREGRSGTCDVTVTDNVAASYLSMTSTCAASDAQAAAQRKIDKYVDISRHHLFFPIAIETLAQ